MTRQFFGFKESS